MDLQPKMTALAASLSQLIAKIKVMAAAPRATAALADQTSKLEGKTLAQVRTQLDTGLTAHLAVSNPHADTAAMLDIPLKTAMDAALANLIPSGILPISSFGSQDYLPPNVSGSFEGGTTASSPKCTAMIMEDDGTMVFLRNGTNGASRGIFYAYIKDAQKAGAMPNPTKTNKQYRPPYFPDGVSAAYLIAGSDSALYGRLINADGSLGGFFLSITNGTFDDSQHVGSIFSSATLNYGAGEVFVAGNTVFHYSALAPTMDVPFEITVRSVAKAQVEAGTATAMTQVTGLTVNGFSGNLTGQNTLRLGNKVASTVAADKPVLLVTGTGITALNISHFENPTIFSVVGPDGTIRTKWSAMTYLATATGSKYTYCTFSFTYNPTTKVANLDDGLSAQNTATFNGAVVDVAGPIFATAEAVDAYPYPTNARHDMCYSPTGYIFLIRVIQPIDLVDLTRVRITNFVSRYEAIRYKAITSAELANVLSTPAFGTAIGGSLVGPFMVALDKLSIYSVGRRANGSMGNGMAWTSLEGEPNGYTHKSINSGTYLGYKPGADRGFLADIGVDYTSRTLPIVEVTPTSVKVIGYNFSGADMSGSTRRQYIDSDFSVSGGTLTVPDTILTNIMNQVGAALLGTIGPIADRACQLSVPQTLGVPPFAMVSVLATSGVHYVILCGISNLTVSNNTVTAATVGQISQPVAYGSSGTGVVRYVEYLQMMGAVTLYDAGTAVLIGVPAAFGKGVVGSAGMTVMRMKYVKASGQFVFPAQPWITLNTAPLAADANTCFASPKLGFGMTVGDLGGASSNDFFTKSVFVPIAKTEAEFDAWTWPAVGQWRVLATQEVAQGWMVYFTDPQPVFLAGRQYNMVPVNMNLLDLTPSPMNKTFYIYVQLSLGIAKYVIRETEINESDTTIYIGRITTGPLAITQITVEKVNRIGTFRISNTPIGSAIPTSAGHPALASKLAWM